ncbi:MAG TPA: ABC transporter ATP-binding protein, partial [Thermotogota bacterium]|nr:ABC transporter ATP-binding protein [Thermotogota bacterium]
STMLISTHLIEEVSSVLEETIVLKAGKVILFQNVEELLASAYMVYGEATNVDRFLDSRKGMGEESMGKFKSAIVLQRLGEKDIQELSELNLESGKVELQKLFIALTNG